MTDAIMLGSATCSPSCAAAPRRRCSTGRPGQPCGTRATRGDAAMSRAPRCSGAGRLGHRVRQDARRGRRGRDDLGPPRVGRRRPSGETGVNEGYLPGVQAAGAGHRHPDARRGARRRRAGRARRAVADAARQPRRVGRRLRPGLDAGLPDEGHRAGHHQADEPGHRGDRRGRPPDRVVVVSGPNLAPEIAAEQPAATVVAGTDPDRATLVQQAIAAALPAAVHQRRRDRLRAGRGGEERDRAGVRDGHRDGLGRQHQGRR